MARRKFENRLIDKDDIKEELRLIHGTDIEYITPSVNVYTYYGDNKFYHKKTFVNNHNGYLYVGLKKSDGKMIQNRVHRLVAEAFVPNPNNLNVVMHIDNDKSNPNASNLKWGTASENTKNAFDDGLANNDKVFDDSQSMPVVQFDLNHNYIDNYGSASIASKMVGITKSAILYQCYHKMKSTPRKGYYYRSLDEYKEKGFVL